MSTDAEPVETAQPRKKGSRKSSNSPAPAAEASPKATTNNPPATATSGYQVARPLGKCSICQSDIAPGDKFMALLRDGQEGLERIDISLDCWENFDRTGALGYWQTTMPQPNQQKKSLFVDDEVLLGLFERLAGIEDPGKLNFRFVLGLILMRKRLLNYEQTRLENETEIWSVRLKGREEWMDLINPRLTEPQMADVSRQLGEILNEDL